MVALADRALLVLPFDVERQYDAEDADEAGGDQVDDVGCICVRTAWEP
jgi:hypothetical protein